MSPDPRRPIIWVPVVRISGSRRLSGHEMSGNSRWHGSTAPERDHG